MWKAIVAGTAALAIAGTSLVYAQRGRMEGRQSGDPARRISGLLVKRGWPRSRLALLTADQEKNWPAFEQAARDFGKLRPDRRSAMRNARPPRIQSSGCGSGPRPFLIPGRP